MLPVNVWTVNERYKSEISTKKTRTEYAKQKITFATNSYEINVEMNYIQFANFYSLP